MKFLFAAMAFVGLVSVEAGSYQCGKHEEFANGQCVCKLGYMRHQGVCKRCPEHSKFSCKRNMCVCANGYTFDAPSYQCVYKGNGQDHSYGNHDSSYGNNHYKCGPNEIPIPGGGCDCDYSNGYARLDGIHCIRCPVNAHWEPAWNRC